MISGEKMTELAKHLNKTNEWYTPQYILDRVNKTLGNIDLDPASTSMHSHADAIITKNENGLEQEWINIAQPLLSTRVFVNPPGGKLGNESLAKLFWFKFIDEFMKNNCYGIFLGFSIEILQTSQMVKGKPINNPDYWVGSYPFVIPSKRIRFVDEHGQLSKAPTHSNILVCVSQDENVIKRFYHNFSDIGMCISN